MKQNFDHPVIEQGSENLLPCPFCGTAKVGIGASQEDNEDERQWQEDRKRREQLRIQALGAALSRKDWWAAERAYNDIRDAFDRPETFRRPVTNGDRNAG